MATLMSHTSMHGRFADKPEPLYAGALHLITEIRRFKVKSPCIEACECIVCGHTFGVAL